MIQNIKFKGYKSFGLVEPQLNNAKAELAVLVLVFALDCIQKVIILISMNSQHQVYF
jgi:hypothetical protein